MTTKAKDLENAWDEGWERRGTHFNECQDHMWRRSQTYRAIALEAEPEKCPVCTPGTVLASLHPMPTCTACEHNRMVIEALRERLEGD